MNAGDNGVVPVGRLIGDELSGDTLDIENAAVRELDELHVSVSIFEVVGDGDGPAVGEGDDEILSGILGECHVGGVHVGEDDPVALRTVADVADDVVAVAEGV